MKWCGIETDDSEGFDTVRFKSSLSIDDFNVKYEDGWYTLSLDECTTLDEIHQIINTQIDFPNKADTIGHVLDAVGDYYWLSIPLRTKPWLEQEVLTIS